MTPIVSSAEARSTANTGTAPALFTFDVLALYVSMGRSRIYGLIAEGEFPPPIKNGRSSRWIKSEIDSWISEQAAARQSSHAGA